MKKLFFLGIFLIGYAINISAQEIASKGESERLLSLFKKFEGTFQLQIIDSRDKTEMPLSLMDIVQAKRHATEVVYFQMKPNVRVMILPLSEINKKGFKPVERIANISIKN